MSCDLNHSEDQRQILASASALLEANYPVSRLRDRRQDDLSELAALGAFSLARQENEGGAGFTLVEEALLHVLLGRHLISTAALAAATATRLAVELGRHDLARQAAAGELRLCAAIPAEDGILLADPEGADIAVVFGARRLALVDLDGVNVERLAGLGHGVPMARICPAATIGESSATALLNLVDLLVSAQLLGIAEAMRDLAVAYAKLRQQFGRPIGAFQAVKHHCANMAIAAEMLSAQLDMAAIGCRDGRDDADFQVAALRLLAPKAALANAAACIQIHGGIGFSAEADAHHYLKQVHLLGRMGGGAPLAGPAAPLMPHVSRSERN